MASKVTKTEEEAEEEERQIKSVGDVTIEEFHALPKRTRKTVTLASGFATLIG